MNADKLTQASMADALREYVEHACGTEGVSTNRGGDVRGDTRSGYTLSPIMLAMIRVALCDVDWIGLAKHYIGESA